MGAEVGLLASRIVPEEAEEVVEALLVVGAQWRRAKPHFVIEVCRRCAIGHRWRLEIHTWQAYQDILHRTDGATAGQFAGGAELFGAALLATSLDYPVVLAGGVHHGAAIGNGEAERFFAIHILASLAGVHGEERMPMVRGGDHHRIDVLAVEKLAVVAEGNGFSAVGLQHQVGSLGQAVAINIAYRHGVFHHRLEVAFSLGTHADKAQAHPFAGRRVGGESSAVEGRGEGQQGAKLQESSSV